MDLAALKKRQEDRKKAQEEEEKRWEEERDRRKKEREERRKRRFADLGLAKGDGKKKDQEEEEKKKEEERKKKEEERKKEEEERKKKEEEQKKEEERKRKEEEEKKKEEKAKADKLAAEGNKKEEKKEEKEDSEINTSDISLDLSSSEDEGVFDEEEDEDEVEERKKKEEEEEKKKKVEEEKKKKVEEEKKRKEEKEKKEREEKEKKEREEKEKKEKEKEKEKKEEASEGTINTSDISLDLSSDEEIFDEDDDDDDDEEEEEEDDEVFDEDEDEDEKKEKEEQEKKAKEEKEKKEKEQKEQKEKEEKERKEKEKGGESEEVLSIEEQLKRRREAREKEREERERKRKEDREKMRREQMAALEEQLTGSDNKEKDDKEKQEKERKEKEEKEKKEKEEQEALKRSLGFVESEEEREERERREQREKEREDRRKMREVKRLANRQQMEHIMAMSAPENIQKRKEEERMKLLKQLEEEDEMYKKDRPVPSVTFPNRILLTREDLFTKEGDVHTDVLLQHLVSEGRLELECCHHLLKKATDILYSEPTLLELEAPLYLVGDIHGQFYDLLNLFKLLGGEPGPDRKYLFLGDYVDRGCFATEIVLYLYALKIKYPKSVYLLRGNHECRVITQHFNFHKECIYKYTDGVYQAFMTSFDSLPVAAVIENNDGKCLALHAGIGPTIRELDHLKEIMRYKEPPETGPLCDALWADPSNEDEVEDEEYSLAEIQEWQDEGFSDNGLRGCSYVYGHKALSAFLEKNGLLSLIRGHSVKKLGAHEHTYFYPCKTTQDIPKFRAKRFEEGGGEMEKKVEEKKVEEAPASPRAKDDSMPTPRGGAEKPKAAPATPAAPVKPLEIPSRPGPKGSDDPKDRYPPCITVFSAPNYCDKYKNYSAALHLKSDFYEIITQKEWEPHPYYLPSFQNAIDFSLPHLARMATTFFSSLLEALAGDEEEVLQNDEIVQKTSKIFTAQTEDVKRGLKPSNIQSKYDQNLQKFEEILSREGGNEQRPQTADWKSLNKTYSSPNLMKMFKRNDMMGREGGTLASRNALHRVASVRLPRMGDIQKSHNRGDIREFAKTLGEQQPQKPIQQQSQPSPSEHKKPGLKLSKSISPRFPRSKSPRNSDKDGGSQEKEEKKEEKGGKGGLFRKRREKSKRNLSPIVKGGVGGEGEGGEGGGMRNGSALAPMEKGPLLPRRTEEDREKEEREKREKERKEKEERERVKMLAKSVNRSCESFDKSLLEKTQNTPVVDSPTQARRIALSGGSFSPRGTSTRSSLTSSYGEMSELTFEKFVETSSPLTQMNEEEEEKKEEKKEEEKEEKKEEEKEEEKEEKKEEKKEEEKEEKEEEKEEGEKEEEKEEGKKDEEKEGEEKGEEEKGEEEKKEEKGEEMKEEEKEEEKEENGPKEKEEEKKEEEKKEEEKTEEEKRKEEEIKKQEERSSSFTLIMRDMEEKDKEDVVRLPLSARSVRSRESVFDQEFLALHKKPTKAEELPQHRKVSILSLSQPKNVSQSPRKHTLTEGVFTMTMCSVCKKMIFGSNDGSPNGVQCSECFLVSHLGCQSDLRDDCGGYSMLFRSKKTARVAANPSQSSDTQQSHLEALRDLNFLGPPSPTPVASLVKQNSGGSLTSSNEARTDGEGSENEEEEGDKNKRRKNLEDGGTGGGAFGQIAAEIRREKDEKEKDDKMEREKEKEKEERPEKKKHLRSVSSKKLTGHSVIKEKKVDDFEKIAEEIKKEKKKEKKKEEKKKKKQEKEQEKRKKKDRLNPFRRSVMPKNDGTDEFLGRDSCPSDKCESSESSSSAMQRTVTPADLELLPSNVDAGLTVRAECKICGIQKCSGYVRPEAGASCRVCQCKPAKHINIGRHTPE